MSKPLLFKKDIPVIKKKLQTNKIITVAKEYGYFDVSAFKKRLLSLGYVVCRSLRSV